MNNTRNYKKILHIPTKIILLKFKLDTQCLYKIQIQFSSYFLLLPPKIAIISNLKDAKVNIYLYLRITTVKMRITRKPQAISNTLFHACFLKLGVNKM